MAHRNTSKQPLLCLKCRNKGHRVVECPHPTFAREGEGIEWSRSPFANDNSIARCFTDTTELDTLCDRCESLNITSFLETVPAASVVEGVSRAYESEDHTLFRRLGTVNAVNFFSDCPLCLCLFSLIPVPTSGEQNIVLGLGWTQHRLEHSAQLESLPGSPSARYLAAVLEPLVVGEEIHRTMSIDSEALAFASNTSSNPKVDFGAEKVDPRHIHIAMIQRWLSFCGINHADTCSAPSPSNLAEIRLIDAQDRCLVPYSSKTRDYLALSYVWGGIDQYVVGAKSLFDALGRLPRTIEDALKLTIMLGKRYIWVDSVCIDQSSKEDKLIQIGLMSSIYRGAYATLIALSGKDAEAGLPRISAPSSFVQHSCTIKGKQLMTLGPTLEYLTLLSQWGERAWTYQEALLSRRCIYMTDYQVHFECNSMTCAESIDDDSSSHCVRTARQSSRQVTYTQSLNLGIYRNPLSKPIGDGGTALNVYSILATSYSRLKMTHSSDALHAFSGILQALADNAYPQGFIHGMPRAHLNWAMAWQAHAAADPRNSAFPTWSWLSNMGGMWPGGPDIGGPDNHPDTWPFDIRLSTISEQLTMEVAFRSSHTDMSDEARSKLGPDPFASFQGFKQSGSSQLLSSLDASQSPKVIVFDSLGLEFAISKRWEEEGNADHSHVAVEVTGEQLLGITTYDPKSEWVSAGKQLWLILTRHLDGADMVLNMLLLKQENEFYKRADMLRLNVDLQKASLVLRSLGLHRLQGTLI